MTNDEMRNLIREAAYMRGIHLSEDPGGLYAFDLRLYRALESFCKQDSETADKKEMQKECRKPVDMSVLEESGIDMCLDIPSGDSIPRMNYWFCGLQFDGDLNLIGRLKTAGFEVEDKWDYYERQWIGFRITGLQDGYCWPWEA